MAAEWTVGARVCVAGPITGVKTNVGDPQVKTEKAKG